MAELTPEQEATEKKIRVSAWRDYLQEPRWCAWFQGARKPDGDGFAKIPLGSHSDPSTWCSFDELCAKLKPGQGFGYNFLKGELHPLDLDHVRNPASGAICNEAMLLLSRLHTYSEVSVSGRGLHVLFKGNVRGHELKETCIQYWNPAKAPRFFTVTAEPVGEAFSIIRDVGDDFNLVFSTAAHISAKCREELEGIDAEQWAKLPAEPVKKATRERVKANDKKRQRHPDFNMEEFLSWACLPVDNTTENTIGKLYRVAVCPVKNAAHVGQNATTTNFGLTADGGLMFHCQSTGCADYHFADVLKVLEEKHGKYPGKLWKEETPIMFSPTDSGNAERLINRHGDNIRFVHDEQKWRIWNGVNWGIDTDGEINRIALQAIQAEHREFFEKPQGLSRTKVLDFLLKCENRNKLENMVACARNNIAVATTRKAFDQHAMLFNVNNGTIDLTTQTFRPHSREDMLIKVADVEYKEGADCPQFQQFLTDIFQDKPAQEREELIAFLQRAVGYSLTADTCEQVCFVMVGPGKNGKGVLLQVMHNLLGEYGVSIPFDMLVTKQNDQGSGPRDGLAQLFGARFARASEGDENKRLHESKLKMMVAPDGPLRGCFLYQEPFEFVNTHKLWMATNYEPVIRGTDEGIWRRINRINFTFQIPEEKRILNLAEKIWFAESSGILNWALEGVRQWLEVGLKPPQSVIKATQEYRAEQNVFVRFAEACLEFDPQGKESATALYNTYKDWGKFSREYVATQAKFGTEFAKLRGVTKEPTWKGVEYRGVKISPKAQAFREYQTRLDGDQQQEMGA